MLTLGKGQYLPGNSFAIRCSTLPSSLHEFSQLVISSEPLSVWRIIGVQISVINNPRYKANLIIYIIYMYKYVIEIAGRMVRWLSGWKHEHIHTHKIFNSSKPNPKLYISNELF